MKCAYCEAEGKMSREHIIPKGFIEHMNRNEQYTWSDKAPSRLIKAELMVKDVCATCNNGELSILDSYALKLILKYNDQITLTTKKVYFKYDKDVLTRWLLKVCYNSARANDAKFDIELYKKNVDYIMRRGSAESYISIFAIYMGTGCLDETLAQSCYHLEEEREYDIDWFRIAPFRLTEDMTFYCASRCVIINSFAFLVVVCDKEYRSELEKIREVILQDYSKAVELGNGKKVCLKRDNEFFLNSWVANKQLRDAFLTKRMKRKDGKLKILTLSKKEIEGGDYTQLEAMRLKLMSTKDDLQDCYQSVIIAFEGYQNDVREPYQSRLFQNYFRNVFDNFPEIIWALLLDEKIITISVMIWAYVNERYTDDIDNDTVHIKADKDKVMRLLNNAFQAINNITNMYAFDFSINQDLTEKFKKCFFKALPMSDAEKDNINR